ncbi:MAG: histidine kinase [Bacteroidales bacterium]|nr:histidine kinase [Bacteroidales bacterium]
MEKKRKIINRENLIYLIIWVMVFAMPVFLSAGGDSINWTRVKHETIRIFPFFIIFLLNNFFLFKYLKNKKYLKYSVFTVIAILVFSIATSFFNVEILRILETPPPPMQRPPMPQQEMLPPMPQGNVFIGFLNKFFYNILFSILVLGLNNAIKILTVWLEDRRDYELLQKAKLQTELKVLRNQISPHFLMNTLNNIHALIDYDKDMAKESIVTLSKLMRVLLYDSDNENYRVKNEIQFLNDYIGLMKIRVQEDVEIKFDYTPNISDYKIPPLLFVSFVENAFKHGIISSEKSYIHINLESDTNNLLFSVSNSKSGIEKKGNVKKIGVENAMQRLDAIYGDNYNFAISETNNNFTVRIKIPLICK